MASVKKRRVVSGSEGLNSVYISNENSTETPTAHFTGEFVYCPQYNSVRVTQNSSLNGTVTLEFSLDGSTVDFSTTDSTVSGAAGFWGTWPVEGPYVRVKWDSLSGGTPASLKIYATFSRVGYITPDPDPTGVTSIIAGTGLSVDHSTGDVTMTNTAPDQTVALTANTGNVSITGSYPNFGIGVASAGPGPAVLSGTAIDVTINGGGDYVVNNTAPDQTVTMTPGAGISTAGSAYPNFDIANTGVTSLTAGTGMSVDHAAGDVTMTNTAPDQTLTSAGGTSILKSYPVLKGLTAGTSISLTSNTNDIQIANTAPDQTLTSAGAGVSIIKSYPVLKSLTAGTAISLTSNVDDIQISNTGVSSLIAGTGMSVDHATGDVTMTNTAPDQTLTSAGGTSIIKSYPVLKGLTAGTAISLTSNVNDVQVTNTAPDQTLTTAGGTSIIKSYPVLKGLTAGTAISLTSNVDDVQIANTGVTSASAGTGMSVSASTGSVAFTNTAPDQTLTSAGGTSLIKSYPVLKGLTAGAGVVLTSNTNDIQIGFTGSLPTGKQMITGGVRLTSGMAGGTTYMAQPLSGIISATDGAGSSPVSTTQRTYCPVAGTFSTLYQYRSTASGSPTETVTMFVNGTAAALTATVSGSNLTATDLVHTVHVNAGDYVYYEWTTNGNLSGGTSRYNSVEFVPD